MIRKGLPIETADLSRKDELNCAEAAIFHQLRERERKRAAVTSNGNKSPLKRAAATQPPHTHHPPALFPVLLFINYSAVSFLIQLQIQN